MSTEHHISFLKSGRFFSHGNLTDGKHLLIALHGYGHLAEYFIRKFYAVDTDKYVVVCPEAPHRFYLKESSGRVGASWMTKEDRLSDIKDYVNFLDTLLSDLKSRTNFESIALLGFSQGGATACRWLAYGQHKFDKFILWATVFPPDMEPEYCEKFSISRNFFVFGTKDEYYDIESIHDHFKEMERIGVPFEMLNFDGTHNIHDKTLLMILDD